MSMTCKICHENKTEHKQEMIKIKGMNSNYTVYSNTQHWETAMHRETGNKYHEDKLQTINIRNLHLIESHVCNTNTNPSSFS